MAEVSWPPQRNDLTQPVVTGASVSLSGPLRRQGQDASDGLRLWVDHVARQGGLRRPVLCLAKTPPAGRSLICWL